MKNWKKIIGISYLKKKTRRFQIDTNKSEPSEYFENCITCKNYE